MRAWRVRRAVVEGRGIRNRPSVMRAGNGRRSLVTELGEMRCFSLLTCMELLELLMRLHLVNDVMATLPLN